MLYRKVKIVIIWAHRRLIALTPAVHLPKPTTSIGICTLLCHDHVFLFLSNIKSLYFFGGILLPVAIIDDGTLTIEDIRLLRKHLINCRIISRQTADNSIPSLLAKFPYALKYWKETKHTLFTHHRKLFEPILLAYFNKCVLLDSDILFFQKPREISDWIKSSNKETLYMSYPTSYIDMHHTINSYTIQAIGRLFDLPFNPYFNSGIVCTYRNRYNLPTIEQTLKMIYQLSLEDQWFGEQLALSAVFSNTNGPRHKSTPLSSEQYVLPSNSRDNNSSPICIHYHSHYKNDMLFPSITSAIRILFKSLL